MTYDELHDQVGRGKLYGALVVARDFSASAIALTGAAPTADPVRPQLQVLTYASAGRMGSSVARTATTEATEIASRNLGDRLCTQMPNAAHFIALERPDVVVAELPNAARASLRTFGVEGGVRGRA